MFTEITDVKEIKLAQRKMIKTLERKFPRKQKRVIGWMAGRQLFSSGKVHQF